MAKLTILEFPDPRLRKKARPVVTVDDRIRTLVDDMLETMYAANGIGLAATQVDVHERVVVVDLSETRDQPQVFINPEVEVLADTCRDYEEGCLSVPGFHEQVSRPDCVRVRALDQEGKPVELEPDGLLAVCLQHELDHLEGKLFVDYLTSLKRDRIRSKLEKQRKQSA